MHGAFSGARLGRQMGFDEYSQDEPGRDHDRSYFLMFALGLRFMHI